MAGCGKKYKHSSDFYRRKNKKIRQSNNSDFVPVSRDFVPLINISEDIVFYEESDSDHSSNASNDSSKSKIKGLNCAYIRKTNFSLQLKNWAISKK